MQWRTNNKVEDKREVPQNYKKTAFFAPKKAVFIIFSYIVSTRQLKVINKSVLLLLKKRR